MIASKNDTSMPSRRHALARLAALAAPGFLRDISARGDEPSRFRIAPFRADITVPIGHPLMGGGVPPAARIGDPLEALGFALLGAGDPIVVATLDWCEVRNDSYDAWRTALADAANTSPSRVLLSSVHQHDAPLTDLRAQRYLDDAKAAGRICDPEFHAEAVRRTAESLRQAIATARPVTHVGTGHARVEQVGSNRRYVRADGSIAHDRMSATRDPYARSQPEGTIDPWLESLSFWDGDTPLVVLHAYSTHPMSAYGKGEVSADFVGQARRGFAAKHDGLLTIYASGCSGNIIAGKYNDGAPENRERLAGRLELAMEAAWTATERHPLNPSEIQVRTAPIQLAPRHSRADLEKRLREGTRPFDQCLAALGLSWLDRVEANQPIEVSALHLGPAIYLLLPAETYVEFQLRAKALRPDVHVVVAGYGECGPGYIPTERHRAENDSNLAEWSWIGPGAEATLMDAISTVLRRRP